MRLGMQSVKGIPVSPGIVMGRAIVLGNAETHVPRREIAQPDLEREVDRLDTALREAVEELGVLRDRTAVQIGSDAAKIFGFHLGLLQDPTLLTPMRERIRNDRVNAEVAVADAFQKLADQFRALGSEMFSQKANDRRVLAKLMGEDENRLATLTEPTIVIAHELTPSQTAGMDRTLVIGIATDLGGRTSHTSIVARAIEIPCVVGCSRVMGRVADGDMIIIDGDTGVVIVRPDARTLAEYTIQQERFSVYRSMLRNTALLEPVTKDGTRIQLLGNIEFPHEVESVFANGGEGVGLYRTEFLFLTSDHEPTEEEQFAAYKQTVELLKGRPLTIRTLDLGADKYTQNRATEPERNPFLGLRSIRYCLQHKALFKTQLRAILRASAFGPMKVMFPLVSTVMELRQARLILNDVAEELAEEGIRYDQNIPIGIMVETPSAALMANAFAKEVSFFSIGTNDLIQYTLAVDRGNERVAHLYSGASPAVLYLVKTVVRTARRSGIDCSLCGEVAGEAIYTMLLIGLGLRTLSLVPSQIPLIKRVIRSTTVENCEELARRVGSFDSERQVLNTLRDELRKVDPGSFAGWIAE